MSQTLDERTRQYVHKQSPLGPTDARNIEDLEVAARLFYSNNNSFDTLLREDLSVVIGRRGSGKTALLNSYKYHPYLKRNKRHDPPGSDVSAYAIVVDISTHTKFEEMQRRVVKDPSVFRPIESIVDDWEKLIIDYFLATLLSKAATVNQSDDYLATIHDYLSQDENQFRDQVRQQVWGDSVWARFKTLGLGKKPREVEYLTQETAMTAATKYLEVRNEKAVIMFDSMDEYGIGTHVFDRTIGALVRVISKFNRRNNSVKIKLVLPSEIFPEVQRASGNPLKDLGDLNQVQWSAMELMQIAAHRYHLFLSLYDLDCVERFGRLDLNRREDVHRFWARFFPKTHKNRYGKEEDTMTYVMRHTQLLPRHLLMILRRIVIDSHELTGGYRQFSSKVIGKAIDDMEMVIAAEIFAAFRSIYDEAERLGKAVFGNCPTIFSYNELENRWRKRVRNKTSDIDTESEMVAFSDMLIRMGIMGLVLEKEETDRYHHGEFGYNLLIPFNIGGGHQLCLHPIFSKHFNAAPNAQSKPILPQGVSIDE